MVTSTAISRRAAGQAAPIATEDGGAVCAGAGGSCSLGNPRPSAHKITDEVHCVQVGFSPHVPMPHPDFALSWAQLCEQVSSFRLIRRVCVQQPSGKLRVIDDPADGGQSEVSHDSNMLDLCTSIQPGLHVQLASA